MEKKYQNKRYDKLVRDKIPEITLKNGDMPVTHIATDAEYFKKLKEKLIEEAQEYSESEEPKELADLVEVLFAICDFKKISRIELEKLRKQRARERGAFKKRIILDETKPL